MIYSLIVDSSLPVKAVLVSLFIASVWSWSIIISKIFVIRRLNNAADQFEIRFWSYRSITEFFNKLDVRQKEPFSSLFISVMRELHENDGNIKENFAIIVERTKRIRAAVVGREIQNIQTNVSTLASISSSAPFIGLFGMICGVMESFQALSTAKNADLTVIAPGMIEAFFVTGFGLFVAIPALIAYNRIIAQIDEYITRLESFSDELLAIIYRGDDI